MQQCGAEEARWAHNPEDGGSKPSIAKKKLYLVTNRYNLNNSNKFKQVKLLCLINLNIYV